MRDTKNRCLLTFLSLLMMRDVFEEVKLGFLVVGLTHEDINGWFGYLSKKLKEENNFSRFDEGFYDLTRETIHSLVDLGYSEF